MMEISQYKQYELDGGKIKIDRHFDKSDQVADLVRNTIIQVAKDSELLTTVNVNGIIPESLRTPQ
jgi:hypothetical protein